MTPKKRGIKVLMAAHCAAEAAGCEPLATPQPIQLCVTGLTAVVLRLETIGKLRRVTSVLRK